MQMMRLPAISSSLCSRLHFAAPCHQTVVQAVFLSPPEFLRYRFPCFHTGHLSTRQMMCSRHQHKSKPRYNSAPLTHAASGGGEFSQSHSCCWAVGLATPTQNGTLVKQEEKLSYQTSKCQTCSVSSTKGLCFFFFTPQQAVSACRPTEIQIEKWERDLWKSHFSSRLFFLDIYWVMLHFYRCNCIHERGNSNFIVNLKIISWGFSEIGMLMAIK